MGEPPFTVLAGDIGGTKTRLGTFSVDAAGLRLLDERSFPSETAAGLEEILADYLGAAAPALRAACFGIAGPVTGRRVRTTNLPWVVDAGELERRTGIPTVRLVNDLEATAWGVVGVGEAKVRVLAAGAPGASGNAAVIAAGTGLGEAGVFSDGEVTRPFACEGGHASFSPTDERGDRLLAFLRRQYETVSWERVVSGPGLADLYRFLLDEDNRALPEWFDAAAAAGDAAAAVSQAALGGVCEVAVRTLELFARLYGEEAGNLALKLMATGGVWVGGGIAPKILPVLEGGAFMRGFLAKGRMRPLLETMPVRVVLDDRVALLGAARCAAAAVR